MNCPTRSLLIVKVRDENSEHPFLHIRVLFASNMELSPGRQALSFSHRTLFKLKTKGILLWHRIKAQGENFAAFVKCNGEDDYTSFRSQ